MKSRKIDCVPSAESAETGFSLLQVLEMTKPQPSGHAKILEGSADQTASALCAILAERGLL